MFVNIDNIIVNLDHVIDIYFRDELIIIYTTDKESIILNIEHKFKLEMALAKYNGMKGCKHD